MICIQVPDPVFEEQVKETDWLLIGAIGGGAFVVVVAEVIIIAAVATRKKKTAAANAPAEASTEQPKE